MTPFSEFILNYDETYSREYLWTLVRCAVTGEFGSLSRKQRSELMIFYENLDTLLSDIYKYTSEAEKSRKEGGDSHA
ncbi:hypothetical protein [Pararcticibacter amylolyticus]|uniref:Four helix bundle protein n=1 Tax=Pararcticibacter amylolyticus TaxID=2173175 RepID=A0A2U2PII7_9SPHI|nr:hypothetical protein [Pararcticibacter amylolyticus]PWG81190.1 hypothetical protein DDR33_07325 [Pararcticibacter amylolyticus]